MVACQEDFLLLDDPFVAERQHRLFVVLIADLLVSCDHGGFVAKQRPGF